MAYVTGTASSMSDLLTALRNACTANGWTLAGSVLHKGGCYARVSLGNNGDGNAPANSRVELQVGNGIDGSNALTDPAPRWCALGLIAGPTAVYTDWDWPATYHIHIGTAPDEVYLFVNYGAGQFWQWLAFGKSPSPGNAGTGNWQSATMGSAYGATITFRTDRVSLTPTGAWIYSNITNPNFVPLPFFTTLIGNSAIRPMISSFIHGCIADASGGGPIWNDPTQGWENRKNGPLGTALPQLNGAVAAAPLFANSPNAWNNEAVLIPLQIIQGRPSDKTSIIGELKHLRLVRNDFIDPGAVITIGTDKWKVYPAYSKNLTTRNGSNTGSNSSSTLTHSGTMAMAIRYDGP